MLRPYKSTALPLALSYLGLIVYASLYPFADWRDQGIAPWAYLTAPLPRYWTGFDVATNVAGYLPLSFLLALALRRARTPLTIARAVIAATLIGSVVSFTMEALQSYLPMRIPSNVDLVLNMAGALIGAGAAGACERFGLLPLWDRLRGSWLVADARGALLLLILWPVALLFPPALPFGLGQVFERLEVWLSEELADTPFLDWLPLRQFELQPLVPAVEMICVMLGALLPCLLVFAVSRSTARRALLLPAVLVLGIAASALSASLSYGPFEAMAWFRAPVGAGLVAAALVGAVLLPSSRRLCAALLLIAIVVHLSLLNQAPTSAYFAQTLATWEQGRFIRFHGLAQWVGWLWPFATLAFTVALLSRRQRTDAIDETGVSIE